MTEDQKQRRAELIEELNRFERRRYFISLEKFWSAIEQHAPEGDFNWDQDEAGDWDVWLCGERDCPRQWHMVAYAQAVGRENGKRYVRIEQADEDGNWEGFLEYDEREGDGPDEWEEMGRFLANYLDEHFIDWAWYWLDAADTGRDPCKQALSTPEDWTEFCLHAARDCLNSLKQEPVSS